MADSLQTAKVQASICELPTESQTYTVVASLVVVFVIVTIALVVRLVSKACGTWRLGIDDLCLIAALGITTGPVYAVLKMCQLGFGKHLWSLESGRLKQILWLFWLAEINYVIVLALVKVALVLFYLRIFPTTGFRIAAYTSIAMVCICSTIITFLTAFSCKPVAYFWDRNLHGTCLDINALAYANSATSIVQDLIIIALPIAEIPRLNIRLKQKIAVVIMFTIGGFGCVTSVIRLRSLLVFGNSLDPTWDYVPVVIWTTLELGAGFVCACLPSIRALLARLFPRVFAMSAHSRSGDGYALSRSNGSSNMWRLHTHSPDVEGEEAREQDGVGELPNKSFAINKTAALPSEPSRSRSRASERSMTTSPPPLQRDYTI